MSKYPILDSLKNVGPGNRFKNIELKFTNWLLLSVGYTGQLITQDQVKSYEDYTLKSLKMLSQAKGMFEKHKEKKSTFNKLAVMHIRSSYITGRSCEEIMSRPIIEYDDTESWANVDDFLVFPLDQH
nr:hypothetical protein [Tanacetum cinerariifolium]